MDHNEPVNSIENDSPPALSRGWVVKWSAGPAHGFHHRDPEEHTGHEIWIHQVDRPAVVFGSTQLPAGFEFDSPVEAGPAGPIELCRRRSGGGLVVVRPTDVWIDAVVPATSTLHDDDVGQAFHWLGATWLAALAALMTPSGGGQPLTTARPAPSGGGRRRPFHCFADVGHGEVLAGDRKVVGLSQRRTRSWTRLQTLFVARWPVEETNQIVEAAMALVTATTGRTANDLGAPPFDAAGVKAGFTADGDRPTIAVNAVIDGVLGRLPKVAPPPFP